MPKTKRPKQVKATEAAAEPRIPLSEVFDLLVAANDGNLPELAEAVSSADLDLALEDRGYLRMGIGSRGMDLPDNIRQRRIELSRWYWHTDPLAKQAVRLWVDYAVGTGIEFEVDDAGAQATLQEFIGSRENKKYTSSAGQQRLAKKHLIDGELFLAVFTGEGDTKIIRPIDPLQITAFLTDPEDEDEIIGFRRDSPGTAADPQARTRYYLAWDADDDASEQAVDPTSGTKKAVTWENDVVVYYFPFDDLGQRGNGLLTSVVSWAREHRRFMESRVSITQALAKFAWKAVSKTTQKGADRIAAKLNSSLKTSGAASLEQNPPPASGSTAIQNQALDITPMPRTTGAGDAMGDMRMLKLQVCAGTGIFEHYMGDPSTGNLATSTAMELPMLKQFTAYQEAWKDAWRDIFAIVLDEDIDTEPTKIKITLPEMLSDDLQIRGTFLQQVLTQFPEAKVPEVLQWALQKMGLEDVETIMTAIAAQREKLDLQAQQLQQAQAAAVAQKLNQPQTPTNQPPAMTPTQEALLERLAESMHEFNRAEPVAPVIYQESPEVHVTPVIVTEAPAQAVRKIKTVKAGKLTKRPDGGFDLNIDSTETDGEAT